MGIIQCYYFLPHLLLWHHSEYSGISCHICWYTGKYLNLLQVCRSVCQDGFLQNPEGQLWEHHGGFSLDKRHAINKQANKPAYLRINEVPDTGLKKENPALACFLSSTASCCHVPPVPEDQAVLHFPLSHSLASFQANKQTGIIRTEERFTLDIKSSLQ